MALIVALNSQWQADLGGQQRAIMLDSALKGFPCEVEAVEICVALFKLGKNAQSLCVVVEAAILGHCLR